MAAPRTLFDKIWDSHVVHRQEDGTCVIYIDRHLVHEVTSPQAFEGLRLAGPQGAAAGRHACRARPQRADQRPLQGHRRRGEPDPGRDAGAELRGFRRTDLPDGRPAPGDRPHHRPRAGLHPARHDDRLRRQPHLDPRRLRRAGLRHRHVGGGARGWRPRPFLQSRAKNMRITVDGDLSLGVTAKGHDSGDHRHESARPAAPGM